MARHSFLPYMILSAVLLSSVCAADAEPLAAPVKCGQMPGKPIEESSGLVRSRRYPDKDIFWTLNDSGDKPRIFAVDSKGAVLATVMIPTAENYDWEDLTADEQGNLIIADIGDNKRLRKSVVLYRFPEPDALAADRKATRPHVFRYTYPAADGAQDAESLAVRGGFAFLITKALDVTRCYRLPLPEAPPAESAEMTLVASTKTVNTLSGAAISSDGMHLALINYLSVIILDLPQPLEKLETPAALFDSSRRTRLAWLGQTEAVAWDGADLVLTTEGGAIFRIGSALPKR